MHNLFNKITSYFSHLSYQHHSGSVLTGFHGHVSQGKKIIEELSIITLVLAVVSVVTVYFPVVANTFINVMIPLLVLFYFRPPGFISLKIGTLVVGKLLLALTALSYFSADWYMIFVVWLLRINIIEAIIKDFKERHIFNAASGIILLMPTWLIEAHWLGFYYIISPVSVIWWIFAYTIWNFNFVFLNFPRSISLFHIAVLASPLVVVLSTLNPGLWLIVRASTLTESLSFQVYAEKKLKFFQQFRCSQYDKISNFLKRSLSQTVVISSTIILSIIFVMAV